MISLSLRNAYIAAARILPVASVSGAHALQDRRQASKLEADPAG